MKVSSSCERDVIMASEKVRGIDASRDLEYAQSRS
jgi:hypothetical protein